MDVLEEKHWWNNLQDLKTHYPPGLHSYIFSSVGNNLEEITSTFTGADITILTRTTPLPLAIDYATPETLGMDRLAAAAGACYLHPGKNILVIDAGSCITYDLVDCTGTFRGGIIAPGLKMRMRSMAHFTRQLPDISGDWEKLTIGLVGKSTKDCLANGAYEGQLHEIEGFISRFRKEYTDLVVMLTGGDADHFESRLKEPIFADSNLVLTGLNRILNYNK